MSAEARELKEIPSYLRGRVGNRIPRFVNIEESPSGYLFLKGGKLKTTRVKARGYF